MSMTAGDIGVLGNLGKALGIFDHSGNPNTTWFGDPGASLKNMLGNDDQRNALIAFVDEAMGGADRETDTSGVVWLPIVHLDDPDPDLTVAVTVKDNGATGIDIGVGLSIKTKDPNGKPRSDTSLSIPLFRARKAGGQAVATPFLLGSPGGRIRIATAITINPDPPAPGTAGLGSVGIDLDVPTSPSDPKAPVFGLSLKGFQLPGATGPRDIRVAADGVDELDDSLLDLVLSLVKSQADAAANGSVIAAVGGMLGLRNGDNIPDFPIASLPAQGVHALSDWLHGVMTSDPARIDWLGYIADLLGGSHNGDVVSFDLGGTADLTFGLRVDTGPTGNTRLTPTLGVELGNTAARVEARADIFRVDLVTGATTALPQFGVWAAAGRPGPGNRVLDVANPTVAQADTLRVGFAIDPQRRVTFVLAADGVTLGAHTYAALDLTSPDAVMDAVGNTVGDIANQLLGSLGDALSVARTLIGLDAPAGITAVKITDLMANPMSAVSGYWQALAAAPAGAMTSVLATLRTAIADASQAASAILGTGVAGDPWRVPLIGPLELEAMVGGGALSIGLAAVTRVDSLGAGCTVVETRFGATIATIDFAAHSASLLPGVEAALSARERGVNPPRVTLGLGGGVVLTASGVGLRLGWSPTGGLGASVEAPNLALAAGATVVPIALPTIAADGTVTLPPKAWDGVEALIGYLGDLLGGFLGDIVQSLGWTADVPTAGGDVSIGARLRLADLVADPASALGGWLPALLLSDLGGTAFALVADLFAGSGANHGFIEGTGHPDDPYRLKLADDMPNIAIWFPPAGLERRNLAAPEALQRWRPGDPALDPSALATALLAEAEVADDIRDLVDGRALADGLVALRDRWVGGDGRIVPPAADPPGVDVERSAIAVGQMVDQLDLENLTGRVPTTTVYVALGSGAWPDAPAGQVVDLIAAGLDASMFPAPTAAAGDWFIRLGSRVDCKLAASTTDGTPEQAARLGRVLDALASVSNDIALVAVAGAGHAARLAAEAQPAITDLISLGTPLGPIALTAISTQPTADALRLLHRLLPEVPGGVDVPEDTDLTLGRALVAAMMELADRADPAVDLRTPVVPPPTPRAGLTVSATFGAVDVDQVGRAITAIVAAGLAARAQARAAIPLPEPTGIHAGLRIAVAPTTTGTVSVSGDAVVQLFAYDLATGPNTARFLRTRLRIADRLGWLTSNADMELRMVTADVVVPLDGSGTGTATVTLHDGRVFGQSWERLILGTGPGASPVLPEARTLLAAAIQRVTTDVAGTASVALTQLLTALGVIAPNGGVSGDAVDQLIHDPGTLVRQRLLAASGQISVAIGALLGPVSAAVDIPGHTLKLSGGGDSSGRFGWHSDITASPAGLTGQLRFGAAAPGPMGGLSVVVDLAPFSASVLWHQPGGATDTIGLWPNPDAGAIARAVAKAAPSLGGHAALELMRRADDSVRPLIDASLDALGLLAGVVSDTERAIRPIAPLLADPAGWLRGAESLAASPGKIQGLFDALRPLLGIGGAPGSPLVLTTGVALTVVADGPGARLSLDVDPTAWIAPNNVTGRLATGLGANLTVGPGGKPTAGLELHVGLTGAPAGRRSVHARIGGAGGIEVFARPAVGADIPLLPFAGLGSLSAVAEAALPFLLDHLAEIAGTTGTLVQTVGDALDLRSGAPKSFDGTKLHTWAVDPVAALASAVPSIISTGLVTIAPLLDNFVPASVTVTATANELKVTIGGVSLSWSPTTGLVTLSGTNLAVPGIDTASFSVAINGAGLQKISLTAGPAAIDAGGVTIRPFVSVEAGLGLAGGARVATGLALDDTHRFAALWLLKTHEFKFMASDGAIEAAVELFDPAQVALRVVEVVADLVAAVAMQQQAVKDLLGTTIGGSNVRGVLRGVVLKDVNNPTELLAGVFDPSTLLSRLQRLFDNLVTASISITVDVLTLSLLKDGAGVIGLQVGLASRMALNDSGDIRLFLENDDSWIDNNPPGSGGIFVGFVSTSGSVKFEPKLTVNGVGLRIGKASGPLLDAGLSIDSIALHTYAEIVFTGSVVRSGGVQLQLSNLAVSAGGAKGDNGIAQGIMKDTGPQPPKPAFSPALAIQKHANDPVSVSLRAGEDPGPWWIAIRKGFGPLYLEQVGFGAQSVGGELKSISVLMDGSVSMFGLTCAVDDLQITYMVSNGDFFNANNWAVDLAGLAVSANMAGVTIAGGLLKQTTDQGTEYLGMLLGRFAVYGITIYGGYGEGKVGNEKFTSFFAIGAINGPIGGPPAFFLTGIGGGFGINRKMVVPTDLSKFGEYPLIKALDVAAKPSNPMDELRSLGSFFPMEKGTFWFAAGISFTSFALVDGIAVIAVQIGDGLDISLLGLARMALPRPQVALVSIEIALVVRFSSSEGVLWVQAQLTDNSWLLYPDIKLTGGFAYVIWFKGEHRGEFVLTLGGYHPKFHRDGYPEVPRLGLRWSIGDAIVIKSGSYFALTSEALMAGGDFEASAHFGPAWAEVKFGANGIVYFDPFHYEVSAYAHIAAGVTIDTWIFGEITISISIGAEIEVTGPDFHGKASFEVGPVGLTVEFGGGDKAQKQPMGAGEFIGKYLDPAKDGTAALAHAAMTSFGAQPSKGEKSTPDGSEARPFVVVVEFGLTFTSTVPATSVVRTAAAANATSNHPASRILGVAPMDASSVQPRITLTWSRAGQTQAFPFVATARPFGAFPVGVWGPPQDSNNRKVPKAEMIEALSELDLVALSTPSPGGPEIPYYQVDIGPRKPLPFSHTVAQISALKALANSVAGLVSAPADVAAAFNNAKTFMTGTSSRTALAAMRGEREAPPLVGALAERLDVDAITVVPTPGASPPGKVYDHFVDAPIAIGLLANSAQGLRTASPARTTVKGSQRAWRVAPPTLASVEAQRSRSVAARLVVAEPPAVSTARTDLRSGGPRGRRSVAASNVPTPARTVIGAIDVPPTAIAHAPTAVIARADGAGGAQLDAFSAALTAGRRVGRGTAGATLQSGEIAVLKLPNANHDAAIDGQRPRLGVVGAPARLIVVGHGGAVLSDGVVGAGEPAENVEIVQGAERIVAVGSVKSESNDADASANGLSGWHAGTQLPYAGWGTAIGAGCVVRSSGEIIRTHRERHDAGWVTGAELARGISTVTTRFSDRVDVVVVVLDDPAAFGNTVGGRELLLGLDGATRVQDASGRDQPPTLLTMENRSVLAYDVVPSQNKPVVVTIASELGWSLVGVMGAAGVSATSAIALISARGLDAALRPLSGRNNGSSRLAWLGETRTAQQRRVAKAFATGRPATSKPATSKPATSKPATSNRGKR